MLTKPRSSPGSQVPYVVELINQCRDIFVDEYFPKDVRSSAQGLFNVMILGIGVLVANSICPYLMQHVFTRNGVTDFRGLFLVPLASASAAAIALALFFRPPPKTPSVPTPQTEASVAV